MDPIDKKPAYVINAPLSFRLAGIAILSLLVAGQINRGIYQLAWNPRPIGPWSQPHKDAPPRKWYDRLPFLGWFTLEREGKIHGSWFWIRPMLIEVAFALGMCALYVWEIGGGLRGGAVVEAGEILAEYSSHYLLIALMTVATFIDIDEKTIPDEITIPGTLAGLTLATLLPSSLLPDGPSTLWLTAPEPWQSWLHGPRGCCSACCVLLAGAWRCCDARFGFVAGSSRDCATCLSASGGIVQQENRRAVADRQRCYRACLVVARPGRCGDSLAGAADEPGRHRGRRSASVVHPRRGQRLAGQGGARVWRCHADWP